MSSSFTIAKGARIEVLLEIEFLLNDALDSGHSYEEFMRQLKARMTNEGWLSTGASHELKSRTQLSSKDDFLEGLLRCFQSEEMIGVQDLPEFPIHVPQVEDGKFVMQLILNAAKDRKYTFEAAVNSLMSQFGHWPPYAPIVEILSEVVAP